MAGDSAEPPESLDTGIVPAMGINEVTEGALLFGTNQMGRFRPAPLLKTDVLIAITGVIARATVRQWFTNPSRQKADRLEGIYVFSLPETTTVDHLGMKVADRIIEGQIKKRTEAKKLCDQAKQEGNWSSLVEQGRPNIFRPPWRIAGPENISSLKSNTRRRSVMRPTSFSSAFPWRMDSNTRLPVIFEAHDPKEFGTILDTDRVRDASRMTPRRNCLVTAHPLSLTLGSFSERAATE